MKKLIILILFLIQTISFAQKIIFNTSQNNNFSEKDIKPKVFYEKGNDTENYYISINGKQYLSYDTLYTLKSDSIKSVFTKKINEKTSNINVNTRFNYEPKLITIKDLVLKYTSLKRNSNFIFSIDEKIINANENTMHVDEKNIMKINVIKLEKLPNFKNLYLINFTTRSKKNVEKANEIILR